VFGYGAVAVVGLGVGLVGLANYAQHCDDTVAQNLAIGGFVVAAIFTAAAAVSVTRRGTGSGWRQPIGSG